MIIHITSGCGCSAASAGAPSAHSRQPCSASPLVSSSARARGSHARRRSTHAASSSAGGGVELDTKASAPDTLDQTAEDFAAWADSVGVQSPKLRMDLFDGIRGMAAREAVQPGDCLVALPRESALLVTPGQRCPFPDWVDAGFWNGSTWGVRLALMLLHERQQGAASRVAGYVQQLPQSFDTPLHWSPAEREALQYPHLVNEVGQQERRWRQLHGALMDCSPRCGVGADDFTWAMECVYSRAFSGPYSGGTVKQKGAVAGVLAVLGTGSVLSGAASLENVLNAGIAAVLFNIIYDILLGTKLTWHALCPVIDSMNHSSASQSQVAYDYFRDRFSVEANDPVQQDAQAFITYGRQGNDRLLQFYGFVEAGNPADTYVVCNLDSAIEEVLGQPLAAGRRQALEELGLAAALQQGTFNRTGLAAETLAAARVALLPENPSRSSVADFQRPASTPQAEALVSRVLAKVLEAEQRRLAAAPPPGDVIQNPDRSALISAFRHEKATVLMAAAASFNELATMLQERSGGDGGGGSVQ